MNKFSLKSNYQPTGDQPRAIGQLIGGLEANQKQQTLLGVTGSGKSVVGDTTVMIRRGKTITSVRIGRLIDDLFNGNTSKIQQSGTSEFINSSDLSANERFDTMSFSPLNGKAGWRPVTQISRHKADDILEVQTACGRAVATTSDHNFFVARHGGIDLTDGVGLKVGDYVPVLRDWSARRSLSDMQYISLPHELTRCEGKWYVSGVEARQDLHQLLLDNGLSKQKLWRNIHQSERVDMDMLLQINPASWSGLFVGSYHQTYDLPAALPVSDNLLRLIGYYIAEGCYTERYVTISTGEPEVVQALQAAALQLGISCHHRTDTYDYQLSSTLLAALLNLWCGRLSSGKHLPAWWPSLSRRQLGVLVGAYYDGDGSVEKLTISASSTSRKLVSDLQYALASLGAESRVRQKMVKYQGSLRENWVIGITGVNRFAFRDAVQLTVARKRIAVASLRPGGRNTNVDVIPLYGVAFKKLRLQCNMSQTEWAQFAGCARSQISLIEHGLRKPSHSLVQQLLLHLVAKSGGLPAVKTLQAMLELRWAQIAKIQTHGGQRSVYDFAVAENESFLAGNGGIFVHNTFTMANIIANRNAPTLVLAHNKTLAAQLFSEFKSFFPENEVHYFVSYFDYYQPEAYIASSDTYIEKDSAINEEIDRLRHAATSALLTRRDVIIVASVSCIYGIGSPDDYAEMSITVEKSERRVQEKFVRQLTDIQYSRNDIDFHRGTFRVRGDVVDIFPAGHDTAFRIEFFGDVVERITQIDPLTGEIISEPAFVKIFPSSHYVTPREKVAVAIENIKLEFENRMAWYEKHNKLLEAQRLSQRTKYDLEMLEETGFVKGIENYSRYLTNREPGEQPATLMDYFPDDFLLFIDESHVTIPQVRGMYNGDRARKEVLVEHGFRLPSALDNRPLRFDEFDRHINQVIYVSATPGQYELEHSPAPAQQIIRPTGLLDPKVEVRPSEGQIDDLIAEIRDRTEKSQRVLVTTLTKRMAEDLSAHLIELGIKTAYIHSDIDTLERGDILRDLRLGIYDVLVGINLLREGLDLPEVSLVAIIDADKEGFLRSEGALIQTTGRAARHVDGMVIMYADRMTDSMKRAISETNRRRDIQQAYNTEHGITPRGVAKEISEGLRAIIPQKDSDLKEKINLNKIPKDEYASLVKDLTGQMQLASANLEFERAAELRDLIAEIKSKTK